MKRWIAITVLSAALPALTLPIAVSAQSRVAVEGDIDIDEGSPWLPLAERVPPIVDLVKYAGVELQEQLVSTKLDTQLGQLVDVISPQVADGVGGYLLRVNLYTDEHGFAVIPGGQLLSAIGPGYNPVDALAESLRKPALDNSVRSGLRESTSFIWIRREGGVLAGRTLSREVSKVVRQRARTEMLYRDLDDRFRRSFPRDGVTVFKHADFWVAMEKERLESIKSAAKRVEVQALTQRLIDLQRQANGVYGDYVRLQREIASAQQQARTLEIIGAIGDIVSNSISLNNAITAEGGTVTQTAAGDVPFENANTQIEYLSGKIQSGNKTLEYQRTIIQRFENDIRSIDQTLELTFRAEGVPIPDRR